MTVQRALVRRPGRKLHWATLSPGAAAWVGIGCNLDIPVFGATTTGTDWAAYLTAAQTGDTMCLRCRTTLLVAGLALHEIEDVRAANADRDQQAATIRGLEHEIRGLRAELARWVTGALSETRNALRKKHSA